MVPQFAIAAACLLMTNALVSTALAQPLGKEHRYKLGDTEFVGYLARQDRPGGTRPAALLVHEWWGLNDFARGQADRLARTGTIVLAVDMYGQAKTVTTPEEARKLATELYTSGQLRPRILAALEELKKIDQVDPNRIVCFGYCMGGNVSLELAYSGARIAGVVSLHGSLPLPAETDQILAPILVLHGDADSLVPPDKVAAFQQAMRERKADMTLIVYPNAKHSFTNPQADALGMEGVGYNRDADEQSWTHKRLFFSRCFQKAMRQNTTTAPAPNAAPQPSRPAAAEPPPPPAD